MNPTISVQDCQTLASPQSLERNGCDLCSRQIDAAVRKKTPHVVLESLQSQKTQKAKGRRRKMT